MGRRIGQRLQAQGVCTVLDLARMDPALARRQFSVTLEKTVRELQGVPCLRFEDEPPPKQQIMVSRSFGAPVTQGRALAQAVTEFMTRAAEKLRAQQSLAGAVGVFIATSPFKTKDRQYSGSLMVPLPRPSADTPVLLDAALSILRALYRRDHRYARAGILLMDRERPAIPP